MLIGRYCGRCKSGTVTDAERKRPYGQDDQLYRSQTNPHPPVPFTNNKRWNSKRSASKASRISYSIEMQQLWCWCSDAIVANNLSVCNCRQLLGIWDMIFSLRYRMMARLLALLRLICGMFKFSSCFSHKEYSYIANRTSSNHRTLSYFFVFFSAKNITPLVYIKSNRFWSSRNARNLPSISLTVLSSIPKLLCPYRLLRKNKPNSI